MINRITICADGHMIPEYDCLGRTGEHNATVLKFDFFEDLNGKSVSDFQKFVVVLFPEGEKSYPVSDACFKLPQELTVYTEIVLRVDMKNGNDVIFRTEPRLFTFEDSDISPSHTEKKHPLIGNIDALNTQDKSNLVNAINEVLRKANQGGDTVEGGNGVGIERIEQTTTSTESNGKNVITVYLTNGDSYNFEVTNGRGVKWMNLYSQDIPIDEDYREFSKVVLETTYSDDTTGLVNFLVPYGKDGKDGEPGKDYVLTDADKAEIAEQAAALIDTQLLSVLGSGVIE